MFVIKDVIIALQNVSVFGLTDDEVDVVQNVLVPRDVSCQFPNFVQKDFPPSLNSVPRLFAVCGFFFLDDKISRRIICELFHCFESGVGEIIKRWNIKDDKRIFL